MTMVGCADKEDLMDCEIYWQVYHHAKHITPDQIESVFRDTFFGFYSKVNDNTVVARQTTRNMVRSNVRQLCAMADAELKEPLDPSLGQTVEVKVFINFGTYVEEVWSNDYR